MPRTQRLILGEFACTLDQRFRLSVPRELADLIADEPLGATLPCMLAKERAGCLSLWKASLWQAKLDARIELLQKKIAADVFSEDRLIQLQRIGRLLSSRHAAVELKDRGRLVIPEGFRKFLGVDRDPPENEVFVVGAAVCIEIWKPSAWQRYLERRMPQFGRLFNELSS